MQTFTNGEMERRLTALRTLMDKHNVDAFICTSFHNTLYYSNFWMTPFGRGHYVVVPRDGAGAVVAPRIEFERPRQYSWFEDVRIYWDTQSPLDGAIKYVVDVLKDRGITGGRIGIEEEYLTVDLLKAFQIALPNCEFVNLTQGLMETQIIKSDEEIELIRGGAQVAVAGARAFLDAIDVGVTEVEVARTAVVAMENAMQTRFPHLEVQEDTFAWCQSGPDRTTVAHAANTWKKIERNQLLSLNVFPLIVGYYHLLERSVYFGDLPDEVRRPLEVQVAAHEAGISAVRPGAKFNEIDNHVNPIFAEAGYLDDRTFGTGHSFGIMSRWYGRDEIGEMRPYNDGVIEKNMVLSIEPMISIEGIGGFRHADMLLVTDAGSEVLTTFRRDAIVI